MKISDFIANLPDGYHEKLKIIKKGIFYILIEEDAFFMSQHFHFKLTLLDKKTIKVGFPVSSLKKYTQIFKEKNISYRVFEKDGEKYNETEIYNGQNYTQVYSFCGEDYQRTKQRILGLSQLGIEEKEVKNFLLKDKFEGLYTDVLNLLLRTPKKQRYFLREKIERIFLDTMEMIYKYMYDISSRVELIEKIFSNMLIIREYLRLVYQILFLNKDHTYINLQAKCIEILKICKAIQSKGISDNRLYTG